VDRLPAGPACTPSPLSAGLDSPCAPAPWPRLSFPPAVARPNQGFIPSCHISYRGLKLPRVSAALGRSERRRGTDLPQVGRLRGLTADYRSGRPMV